MSSSRNRNRKKSPGPKSPSTSGKTKGTRPKGKVSGTRNATSKIFLSKKMAAYKTKESSFTDRSGVKVPTRTTANLKTRLPKGELQVENIPEEMEAEEAATILLSHGGGRFPKKIVFSDSIPVGQKQQIEAAFFRNAAILLSNEREIRPAADPRGFGTRNKKVKAITDAQNLNESIPADEDFGYNLEKLSAQKSKIYVYGKSAMGQGDTAFIVRTVNLLRSLGLDAVGVKEGSDTFEGGDSFKGAIPFRSEGEMIDEVGENDFVIEGPLAEPYGKQNPKDRTPHEFVFERMALKLKKKIPVDKINKLRLYEYGALGLQAGKLPQEDLASNVAHYSGKNSHAFLGMGAGEVGAFFNAGSATTLSLADALKKHKDNPVVKTIAATIADNSKAPIFLGYANATAVTSSWVKAVDSAIQGAVIIGVIGEKPDRSIEPYSIGSDKNEILTVKGIPSEVMNALRKEAQPFTLSTGNYSLSEAIEGGQLSLYEALKFNASVANSYDWHLNNAMVQLGIGEPLSIAVQAFIKAGISGLETPEEEIEIGKKTITLSEAIAIVLEHPAQVKLMMEAIKQNTDVTANLVARLANLVPDKK